MTFAMTGHPQHPLIGIHHAGGRMGEEMISQIVLRVFDIDDVAVANFFEMSNGLGGIAPPMLGSDRFRSLKLLAAIDKFLNYQLVGNLNVFALLWISRAFQ